MKSLNDLQAVIQKRIDANQAKAGAKIQGQSPLFTESSDTPLSPAELAAAAPAPAKLESSAGSEKRGRSKLLPVRHMWFNVQRLEPPALSELYRTIRSAIHGFEHHLQETMYARLPAASKAVINRMLAGDDSDAFDDSTLTTDTASIFTKLKAEDRKSVV